jgi:hypothetical protein
MDRCLKTRLERAQFIVDRDPDGLESSLCRMFVTFEGGRNRCRDHVGKLLCISDWASGDDGSCDSPSHALFSVSPENVSNVIHRPLVDDCVCPEFGVAVHPHVDWSATPIGEATPGFVELMGGDTEVKKESVDTGTVTGAPLLMADLSSYRVEI